MRASVDRGAYILERCDEGRLWYMEHSNDLTKRVCLWPRDACRSRAERRRLVVIDSRERHSWHERTLTLARFVPHNSKHSRGLGSNLLLPKAVQIYWDQRYTCFSYANMNTIYPTSKQRESHIQIRWVMPRTAKNVPRPSNTRSCDPPDDVMLVRTSACPWLKTNTNVVSDVLLSSTRNLPVYLDTDNDCRI